MLLTAVGCTPPVEQSMVETAPATRASMAESSATHPAPAVTVQALLDSSGASAAPLPTATAPAPTGSSGAAETPLPTYTITPTAGYTPAASGPDTFPAEINPLTGLPVRDPASLDLPPVMVSISNSPLSARPQSGLSFSPLVFEMYIGEGVTRFLALFYGDLPPKTEGKNDVRIGPIRSGRLPYERLRLQYKGVLVFASASDRVLGHLDEYKIVYGTSPEDVNDARLAINDLKAFAQKSRPRLGANHLNGLAFDPAPPALASPARSLWLPFHQSEQVFWNYDEALGAYVRTQDDENGKTFTTQVDALTGEPLAFENVIVMFARYHFKDPTFFNIDLQYVSFMPALLFRDGTVQKVFWTTANDEYERKTGHMRPIRLVDRERNPVALKPGSTWVEIVSEPSGVWETVESTDYRTLVNGNKPGSGNWAVFFQTPPIEGE